MLWMPLVELAVDGAECTQPLVHRLSNLGEQDATLMSMRNVDNSSMSLLDTPPSRPAMPRIVEQVVVIPVVDDKNVAIYGSVVQVFAVGLLLTKDAACMRYRVPHGMQQVHETQCYIFIQVETRHSLYLVAIVFASSRASISHLCR
jgi:hypothetical protein